MAKDWYEDALESSIDTFNRAEARNDDPISVAGRAKRIAVSVLALSPLCRDFLFMRRAMTAGFMFESGWTESRRRGIAVDRAGDPLPWLTYGAIAFLSERVRSDMELFEWGCGNSTVWWSKRVSQVVACEHEPEWYRAMASRPIPNVQLLHAMGEAYYRAIADLERAFDIIVIDGRDRVNCARNCVGALREDGVIVWDNSERPRYEEGLAFLREQGFKCLHFPGMGPVNLNEWRTSVFYRSANCLGI